MQKNSINHTVYMYGALVYIMLGIGVNTLCNVVLFNSYHNSKVNTILIPHLTDKITEALESLRKLLKTT